MTVRMDDIFECSVQEYWNEIFLNDEYQRRLHLEGMGFEGYSCIRLGDLAGARVERQLAISGVPGLPKIVQKLVPGGSYVEKGVLDRGSNHWSFVIEPDGVGGRIRITGEFRVEALAPRRCHRLGEIRVKVRLPGVGGAVEKSLTKITDDNQSKNARFTARYIAELRSPESE